MHQVEQPVVLPSERCRLVERRDRFIAEIDGAENFPEYRHGRSVPLTLGRAYGLVLRLSAVRFAHAIQHHRW
jgi:hypothetical protein